MPHTYTCPIIPQNLRKEETYVQIAEALNYLSDVSDDIFRCVNIRINSNRDKLSLINMRIQAAQQKIQRISSAKHAVQIFSSSKYPAAGIDERPYQSLFSTNSPLPIKRFDYQYKPVAQAQEEPLEKLEFYHEPAFGDTLVRLEGLGNVPSDVNYVSDLLFYNSGKNAYKHTVTNVDPLERAGRISSQPRQSEITESNLGDAPQSIADKNSDPLNQIRADSYFYFPDIGHVPTLDVPLDLPDLPGIADDVHYITDKELSIAPSLQHGLSKIVRSATDPPPEIPSTEVAKTDKVDKYETICVHQNVDVAHLSADSKSKAIQQITDSLLSISNDVDISEDVGDIAASSSAALPKPVFSPVDDPHVTLMDAIRKAAGGRNLRAAKVEEGSVEDSTSGGDLMSDLHAKLQMRRKGISGNKVGGSNEPQTVMDKISGMIPPPAPTDSDDPLSESITTEDDEWED